MRVKRPSPSERTHVEGQRPRTLSSRQVECLSVVAAGLSSPHIAKQLSISPRTVDEYISDACARLGVRTRAAAVVQAIRFGLIDA